ncbi:MurR/RpiR family transcriptional regulator [Acutalibacter intestini]|uniref:MurR/RpiR family transcriptional regulator n=1 Tax=Acutalibacter intestini TaxID=3093659 RepID=UPI002AC89651|nr:MurR/RpiR family transcriptional regulator [Acutalibacter sp. M00204]
MTVDLLDPQIQKISYNCLLRIQSVYDSLKSAERKAADYLLADPEGFAHGSIVEVAAKAGCSEATLVRLGYRLAFDGYSELKAALLKKDTGEDLTCLYRGIEEQDDSATVMKKVMRSSIQAIEDTVSLIDTKTYERALEAILKAEKLQFAGIGDASVVAMSGYYKFFRLGMNVHFSQDYDVALMMASQLKAGDVLLAVSHSGTTRTTLSTMHCAKEQGATIIAMTNYPFSPIGKQADILLTTAVFGENMIGESMAKRIPSFCLMESLYINALTHIDSGQRAQLKQRNQALTVNK